ncbi:MAG: CHAT domain-containing protein [Jaaginema sp. PMC 1079.18]|nr:CHAT domain-containing protein [Jaaginema sp. PMC 1080.18]MEC4851619.1 CHAT domain-containing protein [Jaaginema sp. PMC 1079.18]MEC4867926.1 CHAT domain-containing protein [Jaaginema sp. PMC 1078.18]
MVTKAITQILLLSGLGLGLGLGGSAILPLQAQTTETVTSATTFQAGMRHYQAGTVAGWQAAIASWEESLQLARDRGETEQETLSLYWLALTHAQLKDFVPAEAYYQEVLTLYRQTEQDQAIASTLMSLGQINAAWGEYQQALDYYQEAIALWQKADFTTGEAATLNNMGLVYADLGDDELALEQYQKSLDLVKDAGNLRNIAAAYNNLGQAYSDLEEYDQALTYYNQALTTWQEQNHIPGEAATLNNIGFVYAQQENWSEAQQYYNQALPLWDEIGDIGGKARSLTNLGYVAANLGQNEPALAYYNQALPLRQKIGDLAGVALTRYRIAQVQREQGNLDAAQTEIENAIALIEDLRTNINRADLRASFFASKQDYYEFYIDLLMQRHSQNPQAGYNRQALEISEQARARTLLEVLQEANADIRQGVDPQLLQQEQQLSRQLSALEESRLKAPPEQAEMIEQEIEDLLQQYRQLQAQIRATSPRYAALTQPQPLSLEIIQQEIVDEDTLLLEYFVGRDRSYLWVVTPDSMTSYELASGTEIEAAVREWRSLLSSPTQRRRVQKVAALQSQISQMLLQPIANQLQDQRLLVVGNDILQYLPFSALSLETTSEGEAIPLMMQHEIVTLPSASALAIMRRNPQEKSENRRELAIFADPVFNTEDNRVSKSTIIQNSLPIELQESARSAGITLARLPYTRTEAEAILNFTQAQDNTKAFGFEANRNLATSQDLSQYRLLHFATHGLANSENPELSGLVFSLVTPEGKVQNGFLRMHELFNLDLPADLVVLSACQTGLGELVRGEGIIGLTRGFMYAGASRVVVSLWNVDDEGTAELMKAFYRYTIQENQTPAAALRSAQISLWQNPQWRSPYYWAGFTLQGEFLP